MNSDTRLRSILSEGGSSKRDVNVVAICEKTGDPKRNGEVCVPNAWELWMCSTFSRELAFPDSKAEGVRRGSTEVDPGRAYLA